MNGGEESFASIIESVTGVKVASIPFARRDGHGVYVTDLFEQFRVYLGEQLVVIDDSLVEAAHIDESSERVTDHDVPGIVKLFVGWQRMVRQSSPTRIECEGFDVLVETGSAPMPVVENGELWWVSHNYVRPDNYPTID